MWVKNLLKTTSALALFSVTIVAANSASAQTTYYQGTATLGDPVIVDMGVLDNLGSPANLPELLNPGMAVPSAARPSTPPTPQSVTPLPLTGGSAPISSLESSISAPTAMKVDPVATTPTPMKVENTQSAPAPASAPTSGLVGASVPAMESATAAEAESKVEEVDEAMAAAMATTTAEETAEETPDETMTSALEPTVETTITAENAVDEAVEEVAEVAETVEEAVVEAAEVVAEETAEMVEAVEEEVQQIAAVPTEEMPVSTAPAAAEVESIVEETTAPVIEETQTVVEEVVDPVLDVEETVEEAVSEEMASPTDAQTASIDPDAVIMGDDGALSIKFASNSSDLPTGVNTALDELAAKLQADDNLRIQLWGYAEVNGDSPSQARRLSLFRALSVRTYLMKQGVRSTRMDVRALGDKVESGPNDRVDVVFPEKS